MPQAQGLAYLFCSAIHFLDQSNFVFKNGIGTEFVLFLLRELKNNNPSNNLDGTLQLSYAECQDFEFFVQFQEESLQNVTFSWNEKSFWIFVSENRFANNLYVLLSLIFCLYQ